MSAMVSQITSLTIVYSTVYSRRRSKKHQSSASLAFVKGIHRWPVNSPHKGPVTRNFIFHLMTSSCYRNNVLNLEVSFCPGTQFAQRWACLMDTRLPKVSYRTRDIDLALIPSSWWSKYNRLNDFGVAHSARPYKTTGDICLSNKFNEKLIDILPGMRHACYTIWAILKAVSMRSDIAYFKFTAANQKSKLLFRSYTIFRIFYYLQLQFAEYNVWSNTNAEYHLPSCFPFQNPVYRKVIAPILKCGWITYPLPSFNYVWEGIDILSHNLPDII